MYYVTIYSDFMVYYFRLKSLELFLFKANARSTVIEMRFKKAKWPINLIHSTYFVIFCCN